MSIPYHAPPCAQARLCEPGPMAVRDADLLGTALGKRSPKAAEAILATHSKEELVAMSVEDLAGLHGVTYPQALQLVAAFELAKRGLGTGLGSRPGIFSSEDVLHHLVDIRAEHREHFMALYLNARHQVVHREVISIGSLAATIVHPREVFSSAVEHRAYAIIVAHNHPSGDVTPSEDDRQMTERLYQAGKIMGIEVLDHLIVAADDYCSLKSLGYFNPSSS